MVLGDGRGAVAGAVGVAEVVGVGFGEITEVSFFVLRRGSDAAVREIRERAYLAFFEETVSVYVLEGVGEWSRGHCGMRVPLRETLWG